MKKFFLNAAASALTLGLAGWSGMAQAQDVVIMRRVIAPTRFGTATPPPVVTPAWRYGDWIFSTGATCTATAEQTRTRTCSAGDAVLDPSACLQAPEGISRTIERTDGCSYAWGPPSDWSNAERSCTDVGLGDRTVACLRSDGMRADGRCVEADRPPTHDSTPIYTGCTRTWVAGGFGEYSSTCSAAAVRSQTVQCQRTGGTSALALVDVNDPKECDQTKRPPATLTELVTSSCTGSYGNYGVCTPASAGVASGTSTGYLISCNSDTGVEGPKSACAPTSARFCSITYQPIYGSCSGGVQTVTQCISSSPTVVTGDIAPNLCPTYTRSCELLSNGTFEAGAAPWTLSAKVTVAATLVHGGTKAAFFDGSAVVGASVSQIIETVIGHTYTMTGYVGQYGGGELDFYADNVKIAGSSSGNGGNPSWFYRSGSFTATSTSTTIKVMKAVSYGGYMAVDDIVVG